MKNSNDESKMTSLDQKIIHSMADLAVEGLKKENRLDWEPFELYDQKLKSYIHASAFHEKFKKGYQTLLKELGDFKPLE